MFPPEITSIQGRNVERKREWKHNDQTLNLDKTPVNKSIPLKASYYACAIAILHFPTHPNRVMVMTEPPLWPQHSIIYQSISACVYAAAEMPFVCRDRAAKQPRSKSKLIYGPGESWDEWLNRTAHRSFPIHAAIKVLFSLSPLLFCCFFSKQNALKEGKRYTGLSP